MEIYENQLCIACKVVHKLESWRWKKTKLGYYCPKGIDCTGCKQIHYNRTGHELIKGNTRLCGKWFKRYLTPDQKIKGLSPEEVLSGVQYGMPRDKAYGEDSKTGFYEERAGQMKAFNDALKEAM